MSSAADDGCGFNSGQAVRAGHYGIAGMRERAELLGGQFRLASAPHTGTSIRLNIRY